MNIESLKQDVSKLCSYELNLKEQGFMLVGIICIAGIVCVTGIMFFAAHPQWSPFG